MSLVCPACSRPEQKISTVIWPASAAGFTLDNRSLRKFGAAIGAGVLAALPSDRCGLAETARVVSYLAAESAGQCGPCLNGLPRIAAALAELARPRPRRQTRADPARTRPLPGENQAAVPAAAGRRPDS